ncbi:hypothetical protein LINGRAHAP2_LOCUS16661 [Linum grandiflorum]
MASTVGRLFQDSNVVQENVWGKPDAPRSCRKAFGGRKPLGDVSNSAIPASVNQTSKKPPAGVVAAAKASGRKVLFDISNSAKFQKGNEATVVKGKLSVVSEEPSVVACGIAEEGFLHDHDKCIKAQTRGMDAAEFMKIITMEDDFPIRLRSPRASAMNNGFEPESPEKYKLSMEEGSWDFELSPAGKLDSSPSWSPPSSPDSGLSWMDRDDICNFKLIDSP